MNLRICSLVGALILLSLATPSAAHHCEPIGWSQGSTEVALWCLQACREERCAGYERIDVLDLGGKLRQSHIILDNVRVEDAPDQPVSELDLNRSKKLQQVLTELRRQGFQIANFDSERFHAGRYLPPVANNLGVLPMEQAVIKTDDRPLCPTLSMPKSPRSFTALVPFPVQEPSCPGQKVHLTLLPSGNCTLSSNQQLVASFSLEQQPNQWMVSDSFPIEFPATALSNQPVQVRYAYSPDQRAVLLQLVYEDESQSPHTLEILVGSVRKTMPFDSSRCEFPLPRPLLYSGGAGRDFLDYWTMPDAIGLFHYASFGYTPAGRKNFVLTLLEGSFFPLHLRVIDVGVAVAIASARIRSDGADWSIGSAGLSVRLGRLFLESKIALLSFRNFSAWIPAVNTRLVWPIFTMLELTDTPASFLIPAPVVGYDVWFNKSFDIDRQQLWFGVAWPGGVCCYDSPRTQDGKYSVLP